jgi:hypothetical protein
MADLRRFGEGEAALCGFIRMEMAERVSAITINIGLESL